MFLSAVQFDRAFPALLGMAFLACVLLFQKLSHRLPQDRGRALAHDGEKSKGKYTSAGMLFVPCFAVLSLVVLRLSWEVRLYIVAILVEMTMGYLDDHAKVPWSELKKGLTDLIAPLMVALTYMLFNDHAILMPLLLPGRTVAIWPPLFAALIVILCWMSINVTNITDGVDGLSSSLGIVVLLGALLLSDKLNTMTDFQPVAAVFIGALMCYLWYNCAPSTHLMGDAGSRAMGVMLAVTMLKTDAPLLFLPMALVFVLDGASSMVKLTVLRVFKVKGFMKNIRTPLHDHTRKNLAWSDTQTVIRFVILQALVVLAVVSLVG